MFVLIAAIATAVLPVVIVVMERIDHSRKRPDEPRRRFSGPAKIILACAVMISAGGVVTALDAHADKQMMSDAREEVRKAREEARTAQAENQRAHAEEMASVEQLGSNLQRVIADSRAAGVSLPQIQTASSSPQELLNNSMSVATNLVISAEERLAAGDFAGALERYQQAGQLAKVDTIEGRIAQISERMRKADPPGPSPVPSPTPQPVAKAAVEQCQNYDGFKLCTKDVTIAPDRIFIGASVNLVVRGVEESKGPFLAMLPLAGGANVDVGGIANWRFDKYTGIRRCNNGSPEGCLGFPEQFTRLREGSVIGLQLTKPPKDATASILESAQTANVSGQILIIAGNKRSIESYGFSDIPATIKLGKYPRAPTVY